MWYVKDIEPLKDTTELSVTMVNEKTTIRAPFAGTKEVWQHAAYFLQNRP